MVAYDLAMVEARVRFPYSALCSDGRGGSDPHRGKSGHPVSRKGYVLVTRVPQIMD